nr:hypothetical protein [Streptomyces sp. DSM 41633]
MSAHRADGQAVALSRAKQPDAPEEEGQAEDAESCGADEQAAGDQPCVGLSLCALRGVQVFVEPAR